MDTILTIIIPCYNDHRHLVNLFKSIGPLVKDEPIHFLVVDDFSVEPYNNFLEEAREYLKEKIGYISLPRNLGPGGARNVGIDHVHSEFLSFVDSDDYIDETYVYFVLEACRNLKFDVAMFKHHFSTDSADRFTFRMLQEDEEIWERFYSEVGWRENIKTWEAPYIIQTINYPWNKIYRKSYLRKHAIRFPLLRLHEDIPFHWLAMMQCERLVCLSEYPPLISHNRVEGRERATDSFGVERLDLVSAGYLTFRDIHQREHLKMYYPLFTRFMLNVLDWAIEIISDNYKDRLLFEFNWMLRTEIDSDVMRYIQDVDSELASRLGSRFSDTLLA